MQERARGPLSPCQVWWGSDFTRRRAGQKRCVFCLSVCLSVRHAFERQRLCARFRYEGVGRTKVASVGCFPSTEFACVFLAKYVHILHRARYSQGPTQGFIKGFIPQNYQIGLNMGLVQNMLLE